MAATGRLKQTLVRDAIRENVDVIEGRLPKGLRRSDRIRRAIFRASVFVIVPLALFLSINALTTGKGERTDVVVRLDARRGARGGRARPPRPEGPRALALPPRRALRDPRPGARRDAIPAPSARAA